MTVNLSISKLETKTTQLKNSINRLRKLVKVGTCLALGSLAYTGVTVAENIKNGNEVLQDTAVPAAVALAGFGTAVGASKHRNKNTIDLDQANQKLNNARIEEEILAKKRGQEELKKANEIKEAKNAEEMAKSRLSELEQLPNQRKFYYSSELQEFGVIGNKPLKKEGGDFKTGKPLPGYDYVEYYKTKDGYTVEAGIKYASVPEGIKREDYSYRYIKVLDPTVSNVVCEKGQLGFLDEKGFAVSLPIEKKLDRYEKNWHTGEEKRTYKSDQEYYATRSNKQVAWFPSYEQQDRKNVMDGAIRLAGCRYLNLEYDNTTFDPENGSSI